MLHSQKIVNAFKHTRNQSANFITLFNLSLGFFSIISTSQKQYLFGLILILFAALTDRLDGITARKLNIASVLGKHLDSFSDLVSFGLAPAILIYYSTLSSLKIIGFIVAFIFVISGAYRLARYNVTEFTGYYVGLPITIAGAFFACSFFLRNVFPIYFFLFFSLLLSYLMVCRISIKKR